MDGQAVHVEQGGLRAVLQQQLQAAGPIVHGGQVKSRVAVGIADVRVGARGEKAQDVVAGVAGSHGDVQGGVAKYIGAVD